MGKKKCHCKKCNQKKNKKQSIQYHSKQYYLKPDGTPLTCNYSDSRADVVCQEATWNTNSGCGYSVINNNGDSETVCCQNGYTNNGYPGFYADWCISKLGEYCEHNFQCPYTSFECQGTCSNNICTC